MKTLEELKGLARGVNMLELREQIDESWVKIKIDNHLERNPHLDLTFDEVKQLIVEDDLIASFFAKDPSRQNFTEKAISKVVKEIKGVKNFKDLPNSTNLYLVDGELVSPTRRPVGMKNVGYTFQYEGKNFVATQKYTNQEGGAQDNQFNDVATFLRNSVGLEGITAIAIVDGPYYNETRIKQLKELNPEAIVSSGFTLEEELNDRTK